jgi:hypothetical protein
MTENIDIVKSTLIASMRESFASLVSDTLAGVAQDVEAYAAQLADEFARHLARPASEADQAERSMMHLRAQVAQIAAKRGMVVSRALLARVEAAVADVARFAIGVLLALK